MNSSPDSTSARASVSHGEGCNERGTSLMTTLGFGTRTLAFAVLTSPRNEPAPSPLVGEGWGGGWLPTQNSRYPPPCPSPSRGEGTLWRWQRTTSASASHPLAFGITGKSRNDSYSPP